jgi:multisubunit Na+/H+ antiporter MnhB subunit
MVIVLGTLVAVGLIVAVAYIFLTRPAATSLTTTTSGSGSGAGGGDNTVKAILGGVAGAATGIAGGL